MSLSPLELEIWKYKSSVDEAKKYDEVGNILIAGSLFDESIQIAERLKTSFGYLVDQPQLAEITIRSKELHGYMKTYTETEVLADQVSGMDIAPSAPAIDSVLPGTTEYGEVPVDAKTIEDQFVCGQYEARLKIGSQMMVEQAYQKKLQEMRDAKKNQERILTGNKAFDYGMQLIKETVGKSPAERIVELEKALVYLKKGISLLQMGGKCPSPGQMKLPDSVSKQIATLKTK
eukprot:gnl/Carplike_NY0171/3104_a4168_354.p1 GENE.gnl/Carplike_NY0171/3104_a4168_354~~gnl/Carplike_NY0171/3104_a4168_354.p1  ORF type:complete len:232 (-),score=43.72 gnl/Carplike_NY0171/3104_a4168_354:322-1017(-)